LVAWISSLAIVFPFVLLLFPLTAAYGLFMHFCDSNHKITRTQQEERQ